VENSEEVVTFEGNVMSVPQEGGEEGGLDYPLERRIG